MDKGASSSKLTYVTAAAVGVGTVAVIFVWLWYNRKYNKYRPPKKWRKVGEISDLVLYPVKSLGPFRTTTLECTQIGPRSGWIGDRTLMVIDLDGHFVTARQIPKMVQVSPSISGSVLTLNAPGMMSMSMDLARLRSKGNYFRTAVWGVPVIACDCGEEAARWLSRFLLQDDTGLRIVYYPLDHSTREKRARDKVFKKIENTDTGVYGDETSFSLINEASVADMNNRLEEPVTPQQFRMNLIVKGAEAYEEDHWDWVKVGQVIFQNIRPCTRCIITTINPETGQKSPKVEPLKTLKGYRQTYDATIRSVIGEAPMMGIHLGLRGAPGNVRLGDSIYVGITEESESLKRPP